MTITNDGGVGDEPLSQDTSDENVSATAVVAFETRENRWAIETRYVTGVRLRQVVTPLPGSERHVLGCLDVVGSIIPVFCLAELLGMPHDQADLDTCDMVLLGENRPEFALQFMGACSYVRVLDELITYRSPDTFPEAGWVKGTLQNGTIILNGSALLDDGSFVLGQ